MIGFIVGLDPEFPCAFRAEDARMIAVEETIAGGSFRVFVWVGERQSILYFSGSKDECKVKMAQLIGALTNSPENALAAFDRLNETQPPEYMEREGG